MSGDILNPIQTHTQIHDDNRHDYLSTDPLSTPDFSTDGKEKEDGQKEEKVEWTVATKVQLILAMMVIIISICAVAVILTTVSNGKMHFRHIEINILQT